MLTTSVLVSLCKDIEEAAKNAPKVSFQEPTAETSETVEISKEEEEVSTFVLFEKPWIL